MYELISMVHTPIKLELSTGKVLRFSKKGNKEIILDEEILSSNLLELIKRDLFSLKKVEVKKPEPKVEILKVDSKSKTKRFGK
jgi:hypothetical protein